MRLCWSLMCTVVSEVGVELAFYAAEGAGDVAVVSAVLSHEAADEGDDDGEPASDDGDENFGRHILTCLFVGRG